MLRLDEALQLGSVCFIFCCFYGAFIILGLVQTADATVEKHDYKKLCQVKTQNAAGDRRDGVIGGFIPVGGHHDNFHTLRLERFFLLSFLFSGNTIDPKDWFWWWSLTLASLFSIAIFLKLYEVNLNHLLLCLCVRKTLVLGEA